MTTLPYPGLPGLAATRIFLACDATDMRKGFDGLAVMAQQVLQQRRVQRRQTRQRRVAAFASQLIEVALESADSHQFRLSERQGGFKGHDGDFSQLQEWQGQICALMLRAVANWRPPQGSGGG